MDLLDLYHAHDYSLSTEQNYEVYFKNREEEEEIIKPPSREKEISTKKAKFVPWEPFKAAVAATRKGGNCPEKLPELIAYALQKPPERNNNEIKAPLLIDGMKKKESMENHLKKSVKEQELEDEIKKLKEDLILEHKVNSELKRLMIATLNDELQGQVEALTTDKVRLAHRVDEYMGKLMIEDEESDRLKIDRDVWKCKFLAQSIRCDELTLKNEYLLKTLVSAQNTVKTGEINSEDADKFAQLDLQALFTRSPCEEKVRPRSPKYTNLTISCCKNCSGKEIQLL